MSDIQRGASEPPPLSAADGPVAKTEPRGIGGWLIVVAIGQVVGLLRTFVVLGQYYLDAENLNVFEQFPLAMYGELVLNIGLLLLAVTTAALFFRKSRYFPRLFICELVAVPGFVILGIIWMALAFSIHLDTPISEQFMVEREDIVQFSLAVVGALVWIPYVLKSRRVRNAFDPLYAPTGVRGVRAEGQAIGLLRAVVCTVFAIGLVSLLAGFGHAIGRGAFSGQLLGGALQIALAIWLFRGSDIARIVLAFLYALGFLFSVGLALWAPNQGVTPVVLMLAMAMICAACIWALVFSKRFRVELAINAAKYRKPDAETV